MEQSLSKGAQKIAINLKENTYMQLLITLFK